MRKSLEEIQSKHRADMEALQQKLDDAESKKEQAETQFQKLMERVNAIKSQLGARLKEDEVRDHVSHTSPFMDSYSRYKIGGIGSSAIPD
jgi:flagellar biosynthesis chaperone FliJ